MFSEFGAHFDEMTFERLLREVLTRVRELDPGVDTREGSVVYTAAAPTTAEHAQIYIALDNILSETFADTASRYFLIKRAAERGLAPFPAEAAVVRGEFTPVTLRLEGARFSAQGLTFAVSERISDGMYRLRCETLGPIGNITTGRLLPIEPINGLESAQVTELLIPGADEEETEAFRQRYMGSLRSQAFGGNQADYKEKVLALPGVGAVKVFPVWNADLAPASFVPSVEVTDWYNGILATLPGPVAAWLTAIYTAALELLLTVGGTVKLVIMDTTYNPPSADLIADVQEVVDPPGTHGEGLGTAPIGHVVSVQGVTGAPIDVALTLQYQPGWDWAAAESYVLEAIDEYFNELARGWQDADNTVIRVSQIETRILATPGVLDVQNTLLNGANENVTLDDTHIPVRGAVSG